MRAAQDRRVRNQQQGTHSMSKGDDMAHGMKAKTVAPVFDSLWRLWPWRAHSTLSSSERTE